MFDCPGMVAEGAIASLRSLPPTLYMLVADFWQVQSTADARVAMLKICAAGGEGVMLRRPRSLYRNTRTDDLLKLKP